MRTDRGDESREALEAADPVRLYLADISRQTLLDHARTRLRLGRAST